MSEKKQTYTCYHTHDYSVIELNGEEFLNIHNVDEEEYEHEYKRVVAKVEKIVNLLNKGA
jgi:hypothetical protein